MTANQVYKNYITPVSDVKFGEWLSMEKALYIQRQPKIGFDDWLNKKYSLHRSWWAANGGETKKWWEKVADAAKKAATVIADNKDGATDNDSGSDSSDNDNGTPPPVESKKIIGLHPVVFWGSASVVAIGLGYLTYKLIKGEKK